MEQIFETPKYGEVTVSNVMFDDGTNLEEGIEIKGDDIDLIEIYGWRDIDELTISEVERLIDNNF